MRGMLSMHVVLGFILIISISPCLSAEDSTVVQDGKNQQTDRNQASDVIHPVHDVAITNVSGPSNCNQGDTIPITVSLANQGTVREEFTIKLTDQTSGKEIASKKVALAKGWKDGPVDVADAVFTGETGGTMHFGGYVYTGDVNGDNFDDILTSASRWDGKSEKGRLYLYYGGPHVNEMVDKIFTGEADGDRFGEGACLGDFNNDGYADIVGGGIQHDSNRGRAYLWYGGPDLDETTPDLVFEGETGTTGRFSRVMAAGDVNGDNYDDLFIRADRWDNDRGKVYLYFGGNPMDTVADRIWVGENELDKFGSSIFAGVDVDGDNIGDVMISSEGYPNGFAVGIGRAYLYYGAAGTAMDTICDKTFDGEANRDRFGNEVELCDIDNDSFGDVIIGAPNANRAYGGTSLYWGSSNMDVTADFEFIGEPTNSGHGAALACGYFNNDSYKDILVGASSYPNEAYDGRAYIYYGDAQGSMNQVADFIFDGESGEAGRFGNAVVSGDINGDSYDDIVVGAWSYNSFQGRAYLFYGPFESSTDLTFNWDTTNATPGKHTLKASIAPVAGEEDVADNTMTVTVDVTGTSKTVGTSRENDQQ